MFTFSVQYSMALWQVWGPSQMSTWWNIAWYICGAPKLGRHGSEKVLYDIYCMVYMAQQCWGTMGQKKYSMIYWTNVVFGPCSTTMDQLALI